MPHLFEPYTVREITLRNRIGVSPMCQYSAEDGFMNDWHLVHLGSRAVGGAGLVMTEATAVEARGRISPHDTGIWKDEHVEMLSRIAAFIKAQGAVPGIQLAHAGRKASVARPWDGGKELAPDAGRWETIAPSAVRFAEDYPLPRAMTADDIGTVQTAFRNAARRSLDAGFEWVEIHGAHGYLAHEFFSPLSNIRDDHYGGSFENRIRFIVETAQAIRTVWPERLPLATRISCTDWADGTGQPAWDIEQSIELSKRLQEVGVDLIDCSSGGNLATAKIPVGAGYQTPFAEQIKREAAIATSAVGMITDPMQADEIVRNGRADMVVMAREMLRDPYWPLHAATAVHKAESATAPTQYQRAF